MLVLAKDAFWRVFNELRMPEPLPPQDFFLGKNTMDSLDACFQVSARVPKKFKVDLDWKGNHEELFSEKGLLWPPDDKQRILGMHERESEVVHLANHVFPGETGGQWTFFDANHTAERLFALSAKPAKSSTDKAAKAGPVWKDPWKTFVPTLTGKSSIICRCLQPDGSVVLRKLHPLECFRMNLWDLCHWRCECFANLGLELELVHDMAGNMWSGFHFCPLFISAAGAVNWEMADKLKKEKAQKEQESSGGDDDDDDDASQSD